MIAFDALRTALLSDQPWTRLDELVRAEQVSGRTTKQIFDELNGMWKQIDEIPGLSEDGKDAFGDTLDALTGMCHRDCQYKDPPNTTLPVEDEIAKLPRWARVAFAARCARRVLPLFFLFRPDAPNDRYTTLRRAIEMAEGAAGGDDRADIIRLSQITQELSDFDTIASSAAYCATNAASAASNVVDDDRLNKEVVDAVKYSNTITQNSFDLPPSIISNIRRDFDCLANVTKWQHWTDDSSVPPEVFGPLWPEGPPKGWPSIMEIPQRAELPLAFVARDGTPSQVTEDDVVNLFNAMNRYHIARGGAPLTYEDLRSLLPALVPAEV
jgi:hypothetical protein